MPLTGDCCCDMILPKLWTVLRMKTHCVWKKGGSL